MHLLLDSMHRLVPAVLWLAARGKTLSQASQIQHMWELVCPVPSGLALSGPCQSTTVRQVAAWT
jgi:hypothetical protein